MKFYSKLYVGESVKNIRRTKWKLKHNAGQVRVYVITIADGNDLLEIYHCAYLQQAYYKKHPPYIVGIAGGYEEALLLAQRIVEETAAKLGHYRIKNYFTGRSENQV